MTDAERSFELLMFSDEERAALSREHAAAAAARLDALERHWAAADCDMFGSPLPGTEA